MPFRVWKQQSGRIHLPQNGLKVNNDVNAVICCKIRTGYFMLRHHVWPFNPTVSYSARIALGNLINEVFYIDLKCQLIRWTNYWLHTQVAITAQIFVESEKSPYVPKDSTCLNILLGRSDRKETSHQPCGTLLGENCFSICWKWAAMIDGSLPPESLM